MADDTKLSELEQVEEAFNFPLFDAIFNRRSRRFGLGMEIKDGPNEHKSQHEPIPLDEVEEAILIAAGTGISGLNLSDMPHTPRPETLEASRAGRGCATRWSSTSDVPGRARAEITAPSSSIPMMRVST